MTAVVITTLHIYMPMAVRDSNINVDRGSIWFEVLSPASKQQNTTVLFGRWRHMEEIRQLQGYLEAPASFVPSHC